MATSAYTHDAQGPHFLRHPTGSLAGEPLTGLLHRRMSRVRTNPGAWRDLVPSPSNRAAYSSDAGDPLSLCHKIFWHLQGQTHRGVIVEGRAQKLRRIPDHHDSGKPA